MVRMIIALQAWAISSLGNSFTTLFFFFLIVSSSGLLLLSFGRHYVVRGPENTPYTGNQHKMEKGYFAVLKDINRSCEAYVHVKLTYGYVTFPEYLIPPRSLVDNK